MRRVTWWSPLPPQASGISDYSIEVLGALSTQVEIDVHGDRSKLAEVLPSGIRLRPTGEAPDTDALQIYQLGNHHGFHGAILRRALERPGLVVLHETMLHDLVRDCARARGGARAYVDELHYCLGRTGERLARQMQALHLPPDPWRYPLFERIVDRSLGVVVHNETARTRVIASRPAATVTVAPLPLVARHDDAPTGRDRATLAGLDRGSQAPVLGVFGIVSSSKRIDLVLRAFSRLREAFPDARLLLVGGLEPGNPTIEALLGERRPPGVEVLGRVGFDRLLALMASVDVAINLRDPTGGETSATCVRLLGLGRPVVVTRHGWFAEIPAGAVAHLDRDGLEEETLTAILVELIGNQELRLRLGAAGRRWVESAHAPERTVAAYLAAIDATDRATPPAPSAAALVAPPLGDVAADLAVEVGSALGDLGVDERDESILAETARILVEAGLDG